MIQSILPGLFGGTMLAITTGILGVFVIWNKMSYFGDMLSHASLLGIAFGLILHINPYFTLIIVSIFIVLSLIYLEYHLHITIDSLLGIMAHSTLSLGLVIISLMPNGNTQVNLTNYLFGDLLEITTSDLWIICINTLLVLIIISWQWRMLLLIIINPELALIDGINVQRTRLILMMITALTIAIAMKFVGTLLITSLLIIPAATASRFAISPETMVVISIIIGIFAVTGGLLFSAYYAIPTGPSIVLCATLLFIGSIIINKYYYTNNV